MNKIITASIYITLIFFTCQASAQVKRKGIVKKKATPAAAKTVTPPPPPFATAAELEDGKALIAKSDCLACHKIDVKLVGPAYNAVAEKYPQDQNTVNLLSQKVISGGSGCWLARSDGPASVNYPG